MIWFQFASVIDYIVVSGCNTTISHCLTHNKEIIPVIEKKNPRDLIQKRLLFLEKMQIPTNLSYLFSSSHFMHIE